MVKGLQNLERMYDMELPNDERIIELYFLRSEDALTATEAKYGRYCRSVANGILHNESDSEECVNDAFLAVWNSIPPKKPSNLRAFITAVVRNISFDRYDRNRAEKRNSYTDIVFDEFSECIPDERMTAEEELIFRDSLNGFLASLDTRTRIVFMQRYWYFRSIKSIAENCGMREGNVKVILHRTRKNFKEYLMKEGITV